MSFGLFRPRMLVLFALLIATCLTSRLSGQTSTGTLRGQVTDPSGAAVTQATVSLTALAGQTQTAKTNQAGVYEIKGLVPGNYTVKAVAPNFTAFEKQNVAIGAGQVQKLDIRLEIEEQVQQVVVSAEAPTLSVAPENNASSIVIKGKDLEALSDDPDELQNELEALAGPAAGPNGGQIYIDGFTGGQLPPKADILEIRVNQNPFSAEYDKLGYGRIEITTKPGLSQFHGQVFADGNDSVFNSRNPFATEEPAYHSEFFNGNIGGPLSKKAAFFLDGFRRSIDDSSIVSAVDLSPSFTEVPVSLAVLNPRTRTNISPRVDYQLAASNVLTVRYQYYKDNETNDGIGQFSLPSQAYNVDSTEHTLQVSDTEILSARAANDTRFQYLHDSENQAPASLQPTINVLGAFMGGGNNQGTLLDTQDHYELQNYTSISAGKHTVRFGGRLRDVSESNSTNASFNGLFTFSSLNAYQITERGLAQGLTPAEIQAAGGGASQFIIVTGHPLAQVNLFDAGLFAEDEWRMRPNVSLSLGLRYEGQDDIHDHADFAPRLGLAWGIGRGRSPKTVLRTGFGIFYDRFMQGQVLEAEHLNGVNQQQFVVTSPDFFPNIPPTSQLVNSATFPTIYEIDPSLRAPYTIQSAVGLERQISKKATASATYVNSHGVHQLLTRNINAPLPGTYDPSNPESGVRPFGDVGNLYQYESDGLFNQNELIVNFRVSESRLTLFGFYTLNYANSDTGGVSSFPMNQYNILEDYGPTAFDVRHRVFVGGSLNLPRGFSMIPFLVASSGTPFDITVGQDLNGDSIFNDRPAFGNGLTGPDIVATRFGTFDTLPTPGQTRIPPYYGIGPDQFQLNLRLSKTFSFGKPTGGSTNRGPGGGRGMGGGGRGGGGLGGRGLTGGGGFNPFGAGPSENKRYSLEFSVAVHNIFNNVNLGTPIGDLSSPLFGQSNSLAGGAFFTQAANRKIDLQMRFSF